MIYNKDGSIEYAKQEMSDAEARKRIEIEAQEKAQCSFKPGNLLKAAPMFDEFKLRQLALQHAVTTHGATHDEEQVVAAAKAYADFLTGKEPAEVPVDHVKQWEDAAKDVRWPVPSSAFIKPLSTDELAGFAPLRTFNPYG